MRRQAIGVCASTGGPRVVEEILATLPSGYPLPVFVVQHIATGFTNGFAKLLDGRIELEVAIAEDGVSATRGVWLAPDDAHLAVDSSLRVELDRETVNGQHRPSADVLLESLARSFGRGAVAVVLTGMGHDGRRGAAAIRSGGGLLLAQDEPSSTIYGMPRAAAEVGARTLPPADIAAVLRGLSGR